MYRFIRKLNPSTRCDFSGDFVHDPRRGHINGQPVFVNAEKGLFLASYPNRSAWHICSLRYWIEIALSLGNFGSISHADGPDPVTDEAG